MLMENSTKQALQDIKKLVADVPDSPARRDLLAMVAQAETSGEVDKQAIAGKLDEVIAERTAVRDELAEKVAESQGAIEAGIQKKFQEVTKTFSTDMDSLERELSQAFDDAEKELVKLDMEELKKEGAPGAAPAE